MKKVTFYVVSALLLTGILGCCCSLLDTIPPRNLTDARMWVTKRRIIQYSAAHGTLPRSLAELPEMPGYDTKTTDAWGRQLDYSFNDSGVVTIRSFGSDAQSGGIGDAADMVGVFSSRDSTGKLAGELDEWTRNPMGP